MAFSEVSLMLLSVLVDLKEIPYILTFQDQPHSKVMNILNNIQTFLYFNNDQSILDKLNDSSLDLRSLYYIYQKNPTM
jgi:hypothetical protein